MRNIKSLYFHLGRMHCPAHGHSYIAFSTVFGTLGWACTAYLPDGSQCTNRARWTTCDSIRDNEVRALAAEMLRTNMAAV
jgi:hypothetical protein